jgi:CheY-like chemotaxis protein
VIERRGALDGEDREGLEIIRRSGEHLLGLINDVLSIAKIEAGKLTIERRPFDLGRLLDGVRGISCVRAEAKGLEVAFEVEGALPPAVLGDEGKLRQVLLNLMSNAVKFTDRGRVTLRARWDDGRAYFDVEDTGQGISEAEVGKLFEEFSQTESGRSSQEGTGLGLVISRQIVRLMGGDVRVRSRVGEGTTFSVDVDLPASDEAPVDSERRRVTGLAPGQAPPRVLVVDDMADNRLLLVRLLSSVGIEVREAASGGQAVEVWTSWRPDLTFMDMRMPGMDGREATRAIRRLERAAGPEAGGRVSKIVALTASAFEHERDEILSSGADDFVGKPFRVETLFEKLTTHLGVAFLEETAADRGTDDRARITDERLVALAAEHRHHLYEALANGDFAAATAATETIRAEDPALADALVAEIRAFRLDELLSALERVASRA